MNPDETAYINYVKTAQQCSSKDTWLAACRFKDEQKDEVIKRLNRSLDEAWFFADAQMKQCDEMDEKLSAYRKCLDKFVRAFDKLKWALINDEEVELEIAAMEAKQLLNHQSGACPEVKKGSV